MKKKFSIITICFNNKQGLETTIASVVTQTEENYEFIVIDGGSTDGSVEVIKRNEDKITYWVSEKDNGIYDAQNKGAVMANGEYILFLNAGDHFFSNDVLKKIAERNCTADIFYGDMMLEKDGVVYAKKEQPEMISNYYLLVNTIGHQSQFIKTELFRKYGPYDLNYKVVADYEFFVRLFFTEKISIKHIPEIISVYDMSGLSADTTQTTKIKAERKKIHKKYFPGGLVWMYYVYAGINESKLYSSPIISKPVQLMRNLIFKLIKK